MKKYQQAKQFLRDVRDKHFNLHLGASIISMYDLGDALEIMDHKSFEHHVTNKKNDFATWIRNVVGDEKLANHLDRLKTREGMLKAVDDRLEELERIVESGGWNASEFLTSGITDFAIGIIIGLVGGMALAAFI